jgi:hypothetical protein
LLGDRREEIDSTPTAQRHRSESIQGDLASVDYQAFDFQP